MSGNTRTRSNELNSLAAEIAAREHIDPTNPPADNRDYITEIMNAGKCHIETARAVWARYLRRARHPFNSMAWGGARAGAGRKPTRGDTGDSR